MDLIGKVDSAHLKSDALFSSWPSSLQMLVNESLQARIHKKEGIVLMSQDVIRLNQEDTVELAGARLI